MAWVKLIGLLAMSGAFIAYGLVWLKQSLASGEPYHLVDDLKFVFLTPYVGSRFIDRRSDRGRVTRVAPVLWIIGGLAILLLGLSKWLA